MEKKVFCVIPAFNEERFIAEVIKNVKPLVSEVVVVDDCSGDRTFDLARQAGVHVLRHVINRGQGAALATGNEYALRNGADIIIHFDADGQFSPEEIRDVVRPIIYGEADVVFGSRFLEKKSDIPVFKKAIIMPLARFINKALFGINLTDPQCGFRAMSRGAALKVKIEQDRMAHCSEILAKVFYRKLRIKEVPVTVFYNEFGQRLGGGIKILKELLLGALTNL